MLDRSPPLDVVEIERQLRAIAVRLEDLAATTPEMSGLDLAYDRGNVSRDEWEAAEAAVQASVQGQQAELARIEELRAGYPALVDGHVTALLARLVQQLEDTSRRLTVGPELASHRELRWKQTLLPDLIAGLMAWSTRSSSSFAPAWVWRLVYRTTDECAALLASEPTSRRS